ncbi:MAG TPA: isoamylase early set domain-containing protein [Gemmatimonadaceae bacterium]|nr:isoamylase early set domain-containing protein [Gemmatimonadaceae bacterium]
MTDSDPYVEWIAREAKRAVAVDAMAVQRVMERVRQEPLPVRRPDRWRWLVARRSLPLSPLVGAALAAGLIGIGVFLGQNIDRGGRNRTGGPEAFADTNSPRSPSSDSVRVIKFVLVAPHAATVSVVGDFNNWDAQATPMTRTPTGGTWSVALKLPAGRHVYAFVVNGANGNSQWVADPTAPLAPEDGLGAPNSVVLVGGSAS